MSLQVEIIDALSAVDQKLVNEWQHVVEASGANELTQTPRWLLTWWRVFGPHQGRQLRLITFRRKSELVGLAPLLLRRHFYPMGIPVWRLELLGSGEDQYEEICSDYIGITARRGEEQAVAKAFANVLEDPQLGSWEELVLPRLNGESVMPPLLSVTLKPLGNLRYDIHGGAPYAPLPATWDEYLGTLSSSTRYMIRRSLRDFEKWSEGSAKLVRLESASQLDKAMATLSDLHGERWATEKRDNIFEAPRFMEFHKALIPELMRSNAVDLHWLSVDGKPLIAVYNMLYDKRVHYYQSGRTTAVPKKIRLGIVAHAMAIQRAIEAGQKEYDFLDGVAQFKMQLATDTRPLRMLQVYRPSMIDKARRFGLQGRQLLAKLQSR